MAIGRVGSFATTQTPQVDFGGMIRFAQQKQEQYNKRFLRLNNQFNIKKEGLITNAFQPETFTANYEGLDEMQMSLVSKYRDQYYNIAKQIESAKFGDDIGKLKGKLSDLEKRGLGIQSKINNLKNLDTKLKEVKISRGVGVQGYKIFNLLSDPRAKLEKVDVNENGEEFLVYKNPDGNLEKYSFDKILSFTDKVPVDFDSDSYTKELSKQVKTTNTKFFEGSINKEEQLVEAEKLLSLIDDDTSKMINDPQGITSAVYEAEGLKDVYNLGQLSRIYTLQNIGNNNSELRDEVAEAIAGIKVSENVKKAIESASDEIFVDEFEAKDMLTEKLSKKLLDETLLKIQESTTKERNTAYLNYLKQSRGSEDEVTKTPQGNDTMPDVMLYKEVTKRTNRNDIPLNRNSIIPPNDIKNGRAKSFASSPATLPSFEGYVNGELKAISNFDVSNAVLTDKGELALFGSYIPVASRTVEEGAFSEQTKSELDSGVEVSTRESKPKETVKQEDIRVPISVKVSKSNAESIAKFLGFNIKEIQQSQQTDIGIGGLNPE